MKGGIIFLSILFLLACSQSYDAKEPQFLVGSWKLQSIKNNSQVYHTSNFGTEIILTFNEVGKLEGDTSRNKFFSIYESHNNQVTLSEFGISEVNETEFGRHFNEAFSKAYIGDSNQFRFHFTTSSDTLILSAENVKIICLKI